MIAPLVSPGCCWSAAARWIADVLAKFGLSRPLVVTDPFMVSSGHVRHCLDPLAAAGLAVSVFSDTVPDPTDTVIEAGVVELNKGDYDCLIGFGGGSPIDTAKAMAILAAGGGKMRDYKAPFAADRRAAGHRHPDHRGHRQRVHPLHRHHRHRARRENADRRAGRAAAGGAGGLRTDLSVPPRTTADTGVDSLTHALEAYVSARANPISDALALSAMSLIGGNIRTAYAEPRNAAAREGHDAGRHRRPASPSPTARSHWCMACRGRSARISTCRTVCRTPCCCRRSRGSRLPGAEARYAEARAGSASRRADGDGTAAAKAGQRPGKAEQGLRCRPRPTSGSRRRPGPARWR